LPFALTSGMGKYPPRNSTANQQGREQLVHQIKAAFSEFSEKAAFAALDSGYFPRPKPCSL